ncbi:MAG: hypothetical protein IT437_07385 [Phycisphaerales bacterium]|nr:hypothetical protein [Phycisphaerales bacterium]
MTRAFLGAVLWMAPGLVAQDVAPPPAVPDPPALRERAPRGAGAAIFDFGRDRALRAVISLDDQAAAPAETPMLGALHGVLATLNGTELSTLRATVPPNPFLGEARGATRVAVVHLTGTGGRTKRVEVMRGVGGEFIAVEMDGEPRARAELDPGAVQELTRDWPAYRGKYSDDACPDPVGRVFEVPGPYEPGRFTMDLKTIGDRFLRGGKTGLNAATRDLDASKFWARLPDGKERYTPRHPAGLLVWVDARMGPGGGEPPTVFDPALDNLGLICIGAADSGNDRYAVDRYQLALDAVSTATRRWHIDPRRVYIAGISGGGRVASNMVGCFPDVFTGAVPIVGLNFYRNVPVGTGQYVRAGYMQPRETMLRLLHSRPIAPITGPRDGNYNEIKSAIYLMNRDGLRVRLFEYPEMGHEMPTPRRFEEALTWVDGAYRDTRRLEEEAARKAMEVYEARWHGAPPPDAAARSVLIRVTADGPWTDQAWRAVKLLEQAPEPGG